MTPECTCPLTAKGLRVLTGDEELCAEVVTEFRARFPEKSHHLSDDQIRRYYTVVLARLRRGCPLHGGN